MSGHTPGPWVAVQIGETGFSLSVPVYQVRSSDPKYTAIVDAVGEADAHLIAAAPDLLSALRQCAADFISEPCTFGEAFPIAQREFLRRMQIARDAIAKAEGQAERSEGGSPQDTAEGSYAK